MISLIGFISTGRLAAVYVCIKISKVKPKKLKTSRNCFAIPNISIHRIKYIIFIHGNSLLKIVYKMQNIINN